MARHDDGLQARLLRKNLQALKEQSEASGREQDDNHTLSRSGGHSRESHENVYSLFMGTQIAKADTLGMKNGNSQQAGDNHPSLKSSKIKPPSQSENSSSHQHHQVNPHPQEGLPQENLFVGNHPITQALSGLFDPDNPHSPARIIAESLGNKPSGYSPVVDNSGKVEAGLSEGQGDLVKAGEEAAAVSMEGDQFWDLWLGHQDYLRSQCIRLMSGNMADAEDALSNAMVRASLKYGSFADRINNERAWLSKLVYNVCIDHHRKGKRMHYNAFDYEGSDEITDAMFTSPAQSPEEIALTQEQFSEVQKSLGNLSQNLREPLFLRCVEDWSYPDIAKKLNIRTDTVRKRIQLARDYLRSRNIR